MERDDDVRQAMRQCSVFHYRMLDMDQVLAPYAGDLEGFLDFLTREWRWKTTVAEDGKSILADENKPECICPMREGFAADGHPERLCWCSEGFAARMFSRVLGRPVRAEVVRSVIRDGQSCVYRILL